MKVKSVKVYQAVEFNNKVQTWFADDARFGLKGLKMELNNHGVQITLNEHSIVVPFTNIAYYSPEVEQAKPKLTKQG